jgi:uncharacterized membrane protein YeiH
MVNPEGRRSPGSTGAGHLYLLGQVVGMTQPGAAFLGIAAVAVLRLLAILRGWRLPVFRLPQEPQ